MIRFESDYLEGALPEIMARLEETNLAQTPGYGMDVFCASAAEKIRGECAAPGADGDSGFRAIGFAAADMERGISAVVSAGGVPERRDGDRAELLDVSGNKIIIMEEQI